ncbi:MAG: hypothetical protein Q4D79_00050 [Propionibacteriaceae bacterium]|nr:hypothetical protein [Propionibacteriaceae bacterium]
MSVNYNFEAIETPAGAFIGWHENPGQVVTGEVVDYSPTGGQDFSGGACPQVTLRLVEPCSSFNKQGQRTDFAAGEVVSITCGQANLKRGIIAAQPAVGDVLRVTHSSNAKTANGVAKVFSLEIARGAAASTQQAADPGLNPAPVAPLPGATPVQAQPVAPF